MEALLPIGVVLPIAHGPGLVAFHAHRAPVGGRGGHFDGVGVAAFGGVSGVQFVLLEGSFDGVGGLAFAFEIFGVVLLGWGVCC